MVTTTENFTDSKYARTKTPYAAVEAKQAQEAQEVDEEAQLLESIQRAEAAAEPGDQKGQLVTPDTDDTFPAAVSSLTSAGYVNIYDTLTGDRSGTNRNMLPAQLKKRRPNGSLVFTTVKPKAEPFKGTTLCYLHADRPERARFDAMGLPTCKKSNLAAEYHLDAHMKHRHKQEWALLESERTKALEQDERRDRRTTLDLMKHMMTTGSTEAEAEQEIAEIKVVAETVTKKEVAAAVLVPCTQCKRQIKGKTTRGAKAKLRTHMKRVHS